MSDLGYFSDRQIAPSQSLKQILAKGTWSFCQLGGSVVANVAIPWDLPLDTYGILNFSKPCWKFFWQAKDTTTRYVALGKLMQTSSEDTRTLDALAKFRVFGFLSFPGLEAENELWQGFAADTFILPEVEWQVRDSRITMSLRVILDPDFREEDLIQQMADVYRNYAPASLGRAENPLPRVRSRVDIPEQERWRSIVHDATSDIKAQKYKKVVLSRYTQINLSQKVELGTLVQKLGDIEENSYLFAYAEPNGKAFLGRSPERLLSWNTQQVAVDAIAGTRKRIGLQTADRQDALNLQQSPKDIEEHRFVSNYVKDTLSAFCTQVVQKETEELLQLKHVQHMRSTFVASRRKDCHSLDLLRSLHPTPAVGGVPQKEATNSIDRSEPFKRGLFAGAIGILDDDGGDFAIGIRTALVSDKSLMIFAGAGIVEASEPDTEWVETEVKMKNFLELFVDRPDGDEPSYRLS